MAVTLPLVPARITGVYGATNAYHVVGPYIDDIAIWAGEGAGTLGVRACGGLAVGTQVLVAVAEGSNPSRIVAVDVPYTDRTLDAYDRRTLTDPDDQVTGYHPGSWERRILDGHLHRGLQEFRTDGFQDLVNGEWGRCSYFGAAVLVEHFRSVLRAGHFAELAFYTEDQLGRLRSMRWEHDTLFGTSADTFYAGFAEKRFQRWWTSEEAVGEDALPRQQGYAGAGHLGSQVVTAEPGRRGTPRRALTYDFEDAGGTRVIGAAGGVILERRIDLDVAEEKEDWDEIETTPDLAETLRDPRPEIRFDGDVTALLHAQSALDIVDAITTYRSRNAIDAVDKRWESAELEPGDNDVRAGRMWGPLPQSIEIELEAGPKKFYFGRSTIALLPDGGVLIENAYGAQILAAGPNIVLSAPGDIIEMCGGVKQTYAGLGVVIRGHEFVQIASSRGDVDIKAENQFKAMGGNNGVGGVLIESKSATPTSRLGPDGQIGGLVIKSKAGAFIASEGEIGISGDSLFIGADKVVTIDCPGIAARIASLIVVREDSDIPALSFSAGAAERQATLVVDGSSVFRADVVIQSGLLVSDNAAFGAGVIARGQVVANGIGDVSGTADGRRLSSEIGAQLRSTSQSLREFVQAGGEINEQIGTIVNRDVPLTKDFIAKIGFAFTTQYGAPVPEDFGLPEMRWHQRNRSGPTWVENGVRVRGEKPEDDAITTPYPGREVWEGSGKLYRAPQGLFFDAVSARSTLSKPDSPTINAPSTVGLASLVRRP